MRTDHWASASYPYCGVVDAMLAHERTIVPQVAIVRARALARARDALRSGVLRAFADAAGPRRWQRLRFALAAGLTVVASTAAAFQLGLRFAPSAASPTHPATLQHFAQAGGPSPAADTPPATTGTPTAVAQPSPAVGTPAAKAAGASRPASSPAKEDLVIEELRLLERAQQLANRSDYLTVLAIAADHERRYPAGHLCEEREALRLRALIALGRNHEARQVAARFRRDFPNSVLLPKLNDMVAASR